MSSLAGSLRLRTRGAALACVVALGAAAHLQGCATGAGARSGERTQRESSAAARGADAGHAPGAGDQGGGAGEAGAQAITPAGGTGQPLFLWSVDAPGLPRAWLYGSFHLRRITDGELPVAALAAFGAAEVLVMELGDLDAAGRQAAVLMARHGILPGDTRIQDLLDEELLAKTQAALGSVGLSLGPMSHFRPSVVGLMITVSRAARAGFVETTGVDRLFFARLRDPDLPGPSVSVGLETADEQIETLFGMPDALQLATLRDAVSRSAGEELELLNAMLDAYHAGDADTVVELTELATRDDPAMAAYLDRLLYQRNHRMAERLVPLLREGKRLFVVVGTAHLVGREALPDLLSKAGFVVRRHRDLVPLPLSVGAEAEATP